MRSATHGALAECKRNVMLGHGIAIGSLGRSMKTKMMLSLLATMMMAACSTAGAPIAASTDSSEPAAVAVEETPEQTERPDNTLMRVISGEVFYRERIALPKGAVVTVELQDQSRMDAPATVLTQYEHRVDGSTPFAFRLVYDPSKIEDRGRYGLRARIEYEGKLLFTSTEHVDPFAGDRVQILVRAAR